MPRRGGARPCSPSLQNGLSQGPTSAQALVAARVRTIVGPPDQATALSPLTRGAEMVRDRYPQAAELLATATEDMLAFMPWPPEHWRQIDSPTPLARLTPEIGRRTAVVRIFPPRAAGLRLVGAVLMAQTAAWMVAPRRSFRLDSLATLETPATAPLELPAAL